MLHVKVAMILLAYANMVTIQETHLQLLAYLVMLEEPKLGVLQRMPEQDAF
jgi:hypothetical protein